MSSLDAGNLRCHRFTHTGVGRMFGEFAGAASYELGEMRGQERSVEAGVTLAEVFPASQRLGADSCPIQLQGRGQCIRRMSWNCGFLSSPKPTFCPASSQTTTAMGQCANAWFGAALAQLPGGFHTGASRGYSFGLRSYLGCDLAWLIVQRAATCFTTVNKPGAQLLWVLEKLGRVGACL